MAKSKIRKLEVDEKGTEHSHTQTPIRFKTIRLGMDSGAHSLYKKIFSGDGRKSAEARRRADYSYTKTAKFKKYLTEYIELVHEVKDDLEFYVTLDIIGDPKQSWEVTEYIESNGLHPMPVYHFGEPVEWLKKMADRYEYIGVGGMGQDITKKKFSEFAKGAFKILCDSKGHPRHKVHGFALGSPIFIGEYPFYSCDSSTWTFMARCGSLLVPRSRIINGRQNGYDFLSNPKIVATTDSRIKTHTHYNNLNKHQQEYIEKYIKLVGIDSFDLIRESYLQRDLLNIQWFKQMERQAKDLYEKRWGYREGANIVLAGTSSHASTDMVKLVEMMHLSGVEDWYWLVTPEYKKQTSNILTIKHCHKNGVDMRWAQIPYKPRDREIKKDRSTGKVGILLNTKPRLKQSVDLGRVVGTISKPIKVTIASEKKQKQRLPVVRPVKVTPLNGVGIKEVTATIVFNDRGALPNNIPDDVKQGITNALHEYFPESRASITITTIAER